MGFGDGLLSLAFRVDRETIRKWIDLERPFGHSWSNGPIKQESVSIPVDPAKCTETSESRGVSTDQAEDHIALSNMLQSSSVRFVARIEKLKRYSIAPSHVIWQKGQIIAIDERSCIVWYAEWAL
jgi:hypothetical protein